MVYPILEVNLPYPPSANRNWRQGQGRIYTPKSVKAFREAVTWKLLEANAKSFPKCEKYWINVYLFAADKRRRDDDNAQKALWDAITKSPFLWDDDSQIIKHVVFRGQPAVEAFIHLVVKSADDLALPTPELFGVAKKEFKTPSKRTKKQ